MQSTIELFHHLVKQLPPLVPEDLQTRLVHAFEHLEGDPAVTVEEVEDTMIAFGYELWPYIQAYREFVSHYEHDLGEHFLEPKLSESLAKRYAEFKLYGGTLRDLHSGRPADFFSSDERGELCTVLVDFEADLRRYANHQIMTTDRAAFLKRVSEFTVLAADIQTRLSGLRALANSEQDHPTLAAELHAQVRAFEFGLCNLGPQLNFDAVCAAPEHYRGRRLELSRSRGIHTPAQVDFYND